MLTTYVTLSKLVNLLWPLFSYLQNGDNNTHLGQLQQGVTETM